MRSEGAMDAPHCMSERSGDESGYWDWITLFWAKNNTKSMICIDAILFVWCVYDELYMYSYCARSGDASRLFSAGPRQGHIDSWQGRINACQGHSKQCWKVHFWSLNRYNENNYSGGLCMWPYQYAKRYQQNLLTLSQYLYAYSYLYYDDMRQISILL